tara:strand:+ start:1253 stop:1633 length:381 start_codon:yes stop_codon:yes gene_type:complete
MENFKIFQIDLGPIHKEINRLGHEGAAEAYPQYRAYLESGSVGDGYIPEYAIHFSHVADCEAEDRDDCFHIMNFVNRAADKRVNLHSTRVHSLSVGDVIVGEDGIPYMVGSGGFDKIEFSPAQAAQ